LIGKELRDELRITGDAPVTDLSTRKLGVVAIGRNEGERLRRCLDSLPSEVPVIVYVDSGSSDGSAAMARGKGVEVVELDTSIPFTMARARNAGFERLEELEPETEFVQFVDGDCEVLDGWIAAAVATLAGRPEVGAVCGHRLERFPEATLYNRLADMDWRGPVGDIKFCGGDVMMRTKAFREVGGYNERMIAGEDPEICLRLREKGWGMCRIDIPMTLHDAAIARFGQWWRRTVRTGHAYAEAAVLHPYSRERSWNRKNLRNWILGLLLPLAAIASAFWSVWLTLLLLSAYPVQTVRVAWGRMRQHRDPCSISWVYAFFCVLGTLPQAQGQLIYWWRRLLCRSPLLIEYKTAEPPDGKRSRVRGNQ
jgi:GT2 family glycosyltransferase